MRFLAALVFILHFNTSTEREKNFTETFLQHNERETTKTRTGTTAQQQRVVAAAQSLPTIEFERGLPRQ